MELGMVIHPLKCPSESCTCWLKGTVPNASASKLMSLPVTVNPILFLLSFTQVNWWFTVREKNVVSS